MEKELNISLTEQPSPMTDLICEAIAKGQKVSFSNHMGASWLGHPCQRNVWLRYRNAYQKAFSPSTLIKFDIGNYMESRIAQVLSSICKLSYTGSNQLKVDMGPVTCMPDGIIESLPESNNIHVWENKTMCNSDFNRIKKMTLEKFKPEYYIQNQIEMLAAEKALGKPVLRSLYTVENTDTGEVYAFRTHRIKGVAEDAIARANRIVDMIDIPEGISTNPDFLYCKMCPFCEFCHVTHESRSVNCRTCCFSTPREDGSWFCETYKDTIPLEAQKKGCRCHAFIPTLEPYPFNEVASTENTVAYDVNGKIIYNGINGIDSHDLATAFQEAVQGKGNEIGSSENGNIPF